MLGKEQKKMYITATLIITIAIKKENLIKVIVCKFILKFYLISLLFIQKNTQQLDGWKHEFFLMLSS